MFSHNAFCNTARKSSLASIYLLRRREWFFSDGTIVWVKPRKKSRRAKTAKHLKYLKRLGAHIKALRKAQGYSTDRLYLEAGFSRANMTRIEKGQVDPQAYTLKRIADTIGVPVKKLFDFE